MPSSDPEKRYQQRRRYYLAHKAQHAKSQKKYQDSHQEERRLYQQQWYIENRERIQGVHAAYYLANKEDILRTTTAYGQAHPDVRRASVGKWTKAHPDEARQHVQLRRARKLSLPFLWTPNAERAMFAYWHYACAACGAQDGFQWKIVGDHWIPLSSPGCPGTVRWNMVPLCHGRGSCNTSKHTKDGATWLISRFGARKAKAILKRIEAYLLALRPHDVS